MVIASCNDRPRLEPMPKTPNRNPPEPSAASRLMKQADAARLIGVKRQYIPVMIARREIEAEEVAGTQFITRTSAEVAAERRRQRAMEASAAASPETSAA